MKKKSKKIVMVLISVAVAVLMSSCQRNYETLPGATDEEVVSAEENKENEGNKGNSNMTIYENTKIAIEVNGYKLTATPEDNSSATEFIEKLKEDPLEIVMRDYGEFEKVGSLPWNLTTNDMNITTNPGDIILYQGNQITIYYGTNNWNFTRLAHIDDATREGLLEVLGKDAVTVRFSAE